MDYAQMYISGMSIPEVSKETGIPLSTLRFRLKKLGVLRGRSEGIQNAAKRGRLSKLKGTTRVFTDEWKENISKGKRGKGKGVRVTSNGYMEYTMGANKGRSVHVVAMERKIGRRIYAHECVHHIDHNKMNNNIDNLTLMSRKEHASYHASDNLKNRVRDGLGRFK